MRATSTLLALALAAALQPAMADTVTLKFEDLTSVDKIGDRYASSGISFSGDAWGITSVVGDCGGAFPWSRSGVTSCGALELTKDALAATNNALASFTINVAGGFIDAFSFVFAVRANPGVSIQIWDGLNGTGNALLPQAASLTGAVCPATNQSFCGVWPGMSLAFSGVAHSITVSGIDQRLALDDLSFITPASNPNQLPEPTSVVLAAGALGALAWTRRRKAR